MQHGGIRVIYGRDHTDLGSVSVEALGNDMALALSPGTAWRDPQPLDLNEDVCAVVEGHTARLLVVADGHHGRLAAEIAVEHVLSAVGGGATGLRVSDLDLTSLLFEAGLAVQRAVSLSGDHRPASRTTLAMARLIPGFVEWASLGDSCVIVASSHGGARLDRPRSAYLGYWFSQREIDALASTGRQRLSEDDAVVLATDGFLESFPDDSQTPEGLVSSILLETAGAPADVARALVAASLARGSADAVSVAVARPVRSLPG